MSLSFEGFKMKINIIYHFYRGLPMIGDHFSKYEPPNKAEVAYSESAGQHSSC